MCLEVQTSILLANTGAWCRKVCVAGRYKPQFHPCAISWAVVVCWFVNMHRAPWSCEDSACHGSMNDYTIAVRDVHQMWMKGDSGSWTMYISPQGLSVHTVEPILRPGDTLARKAATSGLQVQMKYAIREVKYLGQVHLWLKVNVFISQSI